ncbi:MAG TPA: acyl-CoA dehydrogenase family protein [Terriglobia bacterium]|nr:acyl-CoA dehydrogenase family protein [Terriglobia bacterium]
MATMTATPKTLIKGGSFLIEDRSPDEIFTPEDITDQHRLIAQTAREFVIQEVLPRIDELEAKKPGLLRELLQKAAEVGLCGIDVPQKYGGLDLDKVSSVIVSEETARDGAWSATLGAQAGIGVLPIAFFGTESQKEKYLPKLVNAEWVGAYCLSEATSASDALNAKTKAVLSADGKHYILNGTKHWITNGGIADVYIVFAKVDGEKFTAFIVERSFPGVSAGAEEHKMGIRGSSTTPVNLESALVPVENVLGEIGKGHQIAFNILNMGRLKLGAGSIGGSKYLFAEAVKWAKEREAFGRHIADFGLIKEKLGEMAARIYAAESMCYRTAGMIDECLEGLDQGAPEAGRQILKTLEQYAVECSMIKVVGTELLDFVSDETVQIYGGYGFSSDYPIERAYRDQRVNRIFEGTNEINRLLITDMLMKRSMKGELGLIPAAQRLADETLGTPSFDEPSDDEGLAAEALLLAGAKKVVLLVAGSAVQRYVQALADEQEIVGVLSDLVMDVYGMESALLRTRKKAQPVSDGAQGAEVAATRCFIYEAADRMETAARLALARIAEGDALRVQLAVLRRFLRRTPPDLIGLRRQVANRALDVGRYPFLAM